MTSTPRALAPSVTLERAASRVWDAIVVGAGPAGSMAARETARGGASVLLVDRAMFPRRKVCGCCLNAAALATLRSVGLGGLVARHGAQPLREILLMANGAQALIPLPSGAAVSREAFDTALVEEAIRAGSVFLPATQATLPRVAGAVRRVVLRQPHASVVVEARVVLAADGLSGQLLGCASGFAPSVARASYVGVGATCDETPPECRFGRVVMACSAGGYVGMVRLENGRLNVAAALDPARVQELRGAGMAVARVLESTGAPPVNRLASLSWRGTPALSRYWHPLAVDGIFVLGDAAGYVEPFTGEGIAWALASGVAVAPLALEAARQWRPALAHCWMGWHRRTVARRQRMCRLITRTLRWSGATRAAIRILSKKPQLARLVLGYLNAPFAST